MKKVEFAKILHFSKRDLKHGRSRKHYNNVKDTGLYRVITHDTTDCITLVLK